MLDNFLGCTASGGAKPEQGGAWPPALLGVHEFRNTEAPAEKPPELKLCNLAAPNLESLKPFNPRALNA